ncbi:MAG: RHS repeat domain-containing protein [Velocimicrobium sp.]
MINLQKKDLKKIAVITIMGSIIFSGLNCSYASAKNEEAKVLSLAEDSVFSTETNNEVEDIISNVPDELIDSVNDTSSNILLYDKCGKIINEIHSDGEIVKYEYSENLVEATDTTGFKTIYTYNGENCISSEEYYNNQLIENNIYEGDISSQKISSTSDISALDASSTSPTKTNYIVDGIKMNQIIADSEFVYNANTSWNQNNIQSFLNQKNSILKDDIKVYAQKSDGTVYNTGRVITPAKIIYINARDYGVNPKVILATIQKESSLITSSDVSLSSRRLYYAMGCGATDGGDLTSYTGFDRQVMNGADLLFKNYQNAPSNKSKSIHDGKTITINGVTYPSTIVLNNSATWSLFVYTPHVFDPNNTTSISGGNYLFYKIYKGWGW